MRRSYRRMVWWTFYVYAVDWAFRAAVLTLEGSVFADVPGENGCGTLGYKQLICSGFVRVWTFAELGIVMPKLLLMVMAFGILCCCFPKSGGISDIVDDIRKILMLQQVLTLLSIMFFTIYFVGVHDYMNERGRRLHWFVMSESLLPLLLAEGGRRRCQNIYRESEKLLEQARALARADSLPRMAFSDYLSALPPQVNSSSQEEATCAICLSELQADEIVSHLPCQHVFHAECIRRWFMGGVNIGCPMRCSDSAEPLAPTLAGTLTETPGSGPIVSL